MGKIKILHILQATGGVDVHLRLLLKNMNPDKFEQVIVHSKTDTDKVFIDKSGKEVKEYKIELPRDINPLSDWNAIKKFRVIARNENPDLIHGHSAKGGLIAKYVGKKLGIPVLHTPHAFSYFSTENPIKKNIFLKLEGYFSNAGNKILACSPSEAKRAIDDVGYAPEKVLVFNNSIHPIEDLPPRKIEKTWPDEYITSVGRPSFQKNTELMIEIIRLLKVRKPEIHLILSGIGFYAPNLENIKNKIKEYGLESNITLLSWTERTDILNIIRDSSLYLSTSRYEGLPYSVIEAMALKKAVVASDADGNRDLVVDGKTGYLIKDENPEIYKEKILNLLDNPELRIEFENAAHQRFMENYDINKTIHLLEDIYIREAKK